MALRPLPTPEPPPRPRLRLAPTAPTAPTAEPAEPAEPAMVVPVAPLRAASRPVGPARTAAGVAGLQRLAVRGPRCARRLAGHGALALVYLLLSFRFPMIAAAPTLDDSWNQALGRALVRGLRHGHDVAFTYGPLGWFAAGAYEPSLFWAKVLAWELGFRGALALVVIAALRRIRGTAERGLFCAALLLAPYSQESFDALAIAAIGTWALARRPRLRGDAAAGERDGTPRGRATERERASSFRNTWSLWGAGALLAVLALVKYTNLLLVAVVVAAVVAHRARCAGARVALAHLAGFALLLAGVWTLAGQRLGDLPAWIAAGWRITAGYSQAMAVEGSDADTPLALAVAACATAAILANVLARPRELGRALAAACVAASLFLAFKAGFVRHLENSITFFAHATVVLFLLLPPPRATRGAAWPRGLEVCARSGCVVLGLWACTNVTAPDVPPRARLATVVERRAERLRRHVGQIASAGKLRREYERSYERARELHRDPHLERTVGDATIDYVSHLQGLLFLQDLRWHPRPIFQSYVAYTPALQTRNARFYESAQAPRFVLAGFESLDERLPGTSDALALQVLARDWEPVRASRGRLLLERRSDAPRTAADVRVPVLERTARFGERVDLTGLPGRCRVLALDVRPSLLGRLRGALLRAPPVHVEIEFSDGRRRRFRLVPGAVREGFLATPFLEAPAAWARWLCGEDVRGIARFELELEPGAERFFRPEFGVRVLRADALVRPPRPELLEHLRYPMFRTPADGYRGHREPDLLAVGSLELLLVGAPSELAFHVEPGRWRVTGAHALHPDGWRGTAPEATTDGARFTISVLDRRVDRSYAPGSEDRVLHERVLDPARAPADRTLQRFEARLEVPASAAEGGTLFLRVHPGASPTADLPCWTDVEVRRAE